jgi:hypothetical protein
MKSDAPPEWHRLFNAALNDHLNEADKLELAAVLKSSAEARQLWFLYHDNECSLAEMKRPVEIKTQRTGLSWLTWRPLTAAAAGIVFGMFCTSMVFGFVVQRAVKRTPVPVFDPGLEGLKPLDKGLPHGPDEWGARSAEIVSSEKGVQPMTGKHMLRLQPSLLGKLDDKLFAHAYQVIDLRSLPTDSASAGRTVDVSASFCKTTDGINTRNYIRIFALNESPHSITENFWSKEENEDIVAMAQRFETKTVKSGWHPFSVEMPLPPTAQSLIIIFSATSPKTDAATSYLDEVQVSLISSENPLP